MADETFRQSPFVLEEQDAAVRSEGGRAEAEKEPASTKRSPPGGHRTLVRSHRVLGRAVCKWAPAVRPRMEKTLGPTGLRVMVRPRPVLLRLGGAALSRAAPAFAIVVFGPY